MQNAWDSWELHFHEMSCEELLVFLSTRYSSYWSTLLWLRRLLPEISQRRHKFDPRLVHLKFMMHKEHWEMFFSQHFSFPCQYHSTNAPYSSIYHQRCIMFFSQHFSSPCQYHSTNAPYSFIHLPPTLYNVFLPKLQFPLSVSFHQCSILIHSSTTNTV